jgi:hypothetical protein
VRVGLVVHPTNTVADAAAASARTLVVFMFFSSSDYWTA